MSSISISSSSSAPTPSLQPSHSHDQLSVSTTPATSQKNFLYALLGFTLLSLAAGAAYEWYHRRNDGRAGSSSGAANSGNSSGQPRGTQ